MTIAEIRDIFRKHSSKYYPCCQEDKDNKKTMLAVVHQLKRGGAPLALIDLIETVRDEYNIVFVSQEDGVLAEELTGKGYEVYIGRIDDFSGTPDKLWQSFSIAVFNSIAGNDFAECFQNTQVPVFWWLHEPEEFFIVYEDLMDSMAHLSCNFQLMAVTENTAALAEKYYGIKPEVLPIGIPDCEIRSEDGHDKVRFFIPAAFIKMKGIDIIVQAILGLSDEYLARAEFYFAGAIPEDRTCYNLIEKLSTAMPETVALLGELNKEEVFSVYPQTDCVIAPSRMDALNMTIVEGMMFRKVCITSDACGISGYMKSGENGFVFPSEDVAALTETIRYVIDNFPELGTLADEGKRIYLDHFESSKVTETFREIIRKKENELKAFADSFASEKAVSVIVPCHNMEDYIGRCVESLIQQSFDASKIEIIIVDDASTDGTWEVLLNLERQFPDEIMIIHCDEVGGPGGARNTGVEYAGGRYIMYMDADDCLEPLAIEEMAAYAEKTGCDWVECETNYFSEMPEYEYCRSREATQTHIWTTNARKQMLMRTVDHTAVWGKLYRRSFLMQHEIKFIPKYFYQDVAYTQECFLFAANIVHLDAKFYWYYKNEKGITWDSANVNRLGEKLLVEEGMLTRLKNRKVLFDGLKPYADELTYIAGRKAIVDTYLYLEAYEIPEKTEIIRDILNRYAELFPEFGKCMYLNNREDLLVSVLTVICGV